MIKPLEGKFMWNNVFVLDLETVEAAFYVDGGLKIFFRGRENPITLTDKNDSEDLFNKILELVKQ